MSGFGSQELGSPISPDCLDLRPTSTRAEGAWGRLSGVPGVSVATDRLQRIPRQVCSENPEVDAVCFRSSGNLPPRSLTMRFSTSLS